MLKSYLITCDESQYILPITMYLHNKYRPNTELYCLGYTKPNIKFEDNCYFVELRNGEKRNKKTWFRDIYNYFNTIDDDYIIFTVDDIPIIDEIDNDAMEFCLNYIKNNKVAVFYGYNTEQKNIFYENDKFKLWRLKNNNKHKTNLQRNIWNRKALMEILKKSPSDLLSFEQNGYNYIKSNPIFKDYEFIGMSINNYGIKHKSNLLPTFKWSMCSSRHTEDYIIILALKNEDLKYIVDNNLVDKTKLVYIYTKKYKVSYDIFSYKFNFEKLKKYLFDNNLNTYDIISDINIYKQYYSDLY